MAKIKEASYTFSIDTDFVNLQRFGEDMVYLLKLLKENKLPNENLYLSYIDYNDIFVRDWNYLYKSTNNFFNKKLNSEYNHENDFYFSKSCWLTSELIKNGHFRSYVTAHYNPRLKKIIIHPGSARYKILNLFNNTKQPFIFWNTNEVEYDWMYKKDIIPFDTNYQLFKDYDFTIRPDHGSLIPHFTLRKDGPMDDASIEYYKHIQKILNNLKIKLTIKKLNLNKENSFGRSIFSKFISDDYNCEIIIKNHTKNTIQKALLIMCTGLSYEDDDLEIKLI